MDARHTAKGDGGSIQVNPQLLFRRLKLTVAKKDGNSMQELNHEMGNHFSSLFEFFGFMRQANKTVLAIAVWTTVN